MSRIAKIFKMRERAVDEKIMKLYRDDAAAIELRMTQIKESKAGKQP
jgi:hypothetical protein